MHSSFVRFICRVLVACMVGLPTQAQAGVIGTDQAVAAAQGQDVRAMVAGFIDRGVAAGQLHALGLSPEAAKERVAALTDAEVATLAGQIESLPAGAGGQAIGFLVVALFLLWRFVFSDQAKAETAKSKPKPAPEKK